LDLLKGSPDLDSFPDCGTASSTASWASLPRTPAGASEVYGPDTVLESPSSNGPLWLPDTVFPASREYVPREEGSPWVTKEKYLRYDVPPGLGDNRLPEVAYLQDWQPVLGSIPPLPETVTTPRSPVVGDPNPTDLDWILAWGQGVQSDTFGDVGGLGLTDEDFSGMQLPVTDTYLDTAFKEALVVEPSSSQHGEAPRRDIEIERGAAVVVEPGSQAPGVADNGVAPRLPQLKFPSAIHNATAPGYSAVQKDLIEVSSGTNLVPTANLTPIAQARRRSRRRRADQPATEYVCTRCTEAEGIIVSFNCRKDLKRHKRTTKAHNACIVEYCSCGKGVTRKDAMALHRKYCPGNKLRAGGAAAGFE